MWKMFIRLIVGGNILTVIAVLVVDTGILLKSGIAQDLFWVKDFDSELTLIQLESAYSISKTLPFEHAKQY